MNKVCQQMYTATVRHKSLLENTGGLLWNAVLHIQLGDCTFYMFYMFDTLFDRMLSVNYPRLSVGAHFGKTTKQRISPFVPKKPY